MTGGGGLGGGPGDKKKGIPTVTGTINAASLQPPYARINTRTQTGAHTSHTHPENSELIYFEFERNGYCGADDWIPPECTHEDQVARIISKTRRCMSVHPHPVSDPLR